MRPDKITWEAVPKGAHLALGDPESDLPLARVEWLGGQRFRTAQEHWITDHRHGRSFAIPAGFEFNGASVPRAAWAFASPICLGVWATMGHDYPYGRGGDLPECRYTRLEADRLFYDLMKRERIAPYRSRAAYWAVRAFGRNAWQDR